jgi:hypothetical protein
MGNPRAKHVAASMFVNAESSERMPDSCEADMRAAAEPDCGHS